MGVVRAPSTGGGSGEGLDVLTLENRSGVTILAGYAVQGHASGAGCEAWTGDRPVLGIAETAIEPGFAGRVVRDGPATVAGLIAGQRYYCDADTPGALIALPVLRAGAWIQPVGVALTDNTLEVRLGDPMQA